MDCRKCVNYDEKKYLGPHCAASLPIWAAPHVMESRREMTERLMGEYAPKCPLYEPIGE